MKNFINFKDLTKQIIQERRVRNIETNCNYWIKILDDYLWWVLENELVVIGAGSGVWKTELSWQIAINNALKGKKVALLSLEWDKWEIVYRYIQKEINLKRKNNFIKGPEYRLNLTDVTYEEDQVVEMIPKELETNLFIFDKSEIPNKNKLIDLIQNNYEDVDMFVIDHLHYLDYWKEEASWLTDIVKAIKETTEIVKKPVILVSHLSRAYMNQKRLPNKWDLHWSSNIEKNANTIILLCPWELNEELEKHPEHKFYRPTKIIVDKNRAGMPVPWIFDTTFDLRTKTYLEWWIYEWLSLDDNNRLTVYDKIF